MATIITLDEIKDVLPEIDIIAAMAEGFIQYSNGNTVVPPVAELLFDDPKGDVHIKYGYIKKQDYYCIKIASGFYENKKLGISSSQGLMLLFSQQTGQIVSVLLDDGYLTDIRTAAAGALVAKYFAPKQVKAIGIVGTGLQAKHQLQYLQNISSCKTVWLWGRSKQNVEKFKLDMGDVFDIHIAENTTELAKNSNLIVTTTSSEKALLFEKDIQAGTHITAVGSDTASKQELETDILARADRVISDSISQSQSRGEVFKARMDSKISEGNIIELGTAIQNKAVQRKNDTEITVADLTGVAVQDIMISQVVFEKIKRAESK